MPIHGGEFDVIAINRRFGTKQCFVHLYAAANLNRSHGISRYRLIEERQPGQ